MGAIHACVGKVVGRSTAALVTLLMASTARAGSYDVFTSSVAAGSINASDGYCSLAEAVKSINDGAPVASCVDKDPSISLVTLIEAPGKSYANFHYVLGGTTLTFNRATRVQVSEEGFTAFIDSSGSLAFKVSIGADVTFYGLDIKHTGTGKGRLIWNAGSLYVSNTTVRNGNMTTDSAGKGGGIYNQGYLNVYASQILNNSAKRGGGLYNEDGTIPGLNAVITGNKATMAGGGIYNMATGNLNGRAKAFIGLSGTVGSNTAKAGGGIFNRGEVEVVSPTFITSNVASGTGSGETCNSVSCDGFGGGVLNLTAQGILAGFRLSDFATVSFNRATGLGGAFYNTGQLNLRGISIASNQAKSGAAIYAGALVIGGAPEPNYCDVTSVLGASSINSNTTVPSGGYSIVDSSGAAQTYCLFSSVSAAGNSTPKCNPAGVRPGFSCPQ